MTPIGPVPLGARLMVRVTRSCRGSMRDRLLPGKLVTQIAPAPTPTTDAGSGVEMRAITASVCGSRRVTVWAGPFATQMEPKAAATEPGVGMAIDTTRRPAAGGEVVPVPVVTAEPGRLHPAFEQLLLDEVHAVPTRPPTRRAHKG